MRGGKKVALTYNRHTAQRGYERSWGKAVGSKVPQFPNTHEQHTTPPHHGRVVGLRATLRLTYMGIFLSERVRGGQEPEASLRLSGSNNWRAQTHSTQILRTLTANFTNVWKYSSIRDNTASQRLLHNSKKNECPLLISILSQKKHDTN